MSLPGLKEQVEHLQAVGPSLTLVVKALAAERPKLVALLEGLNEEDWTKPTPCPAWTVHELALHLLGDDLTMVGIGRDGHRGAPPPGVVLEPGEPQEFGRALDLLNQSWVDAARLRVSPRMVIDLLRITGEWTLSSFAGRPWDEPVLGVSWAGQGPSPHGLGAAREFTERWIHQQQLRMAVGAAPISDADDLGLMVNTLLHGLPVAYASIESPGGTAVRVAVPDVEQTVDLVRRGAMWRLEPPGPRPPAALVTIPADPLWRVLSTNMAPDDARSLAQLEGEPVLAERLFHGVAIVSSRSNPS